jgi:hypothetical protein
MPAHVQHLRQVEACEICEHPVRRLSTDQAGDLEAECALFMRLAPEQQVQGAASRSAVPALWVQCQAAQRAGSVGAQPQRECGIRRIRQRTPP